METTPTIHRNPCRNSFRHGFSRLRLREFMPEESPEWFVRRLGPELSAGASPAPSYQLIN